MPRLRNSQTLVSDLGYTLPVHIVIGHQQSLQDVTKRLDEYIGRDGPVFVELFQDHERTIRASTPDAKRVIELLQVETDLR